MSKRNFILLIIILLVVVLVILGFLYFRQTTNPPGDTGTGTNFFAPFNPFGSSTTNPPVAPPADISGYVPPPEEVVVNEKLKKISSMPIAGFATYNKERLKNLPTTEPVATTSDETPPKTAAKSTQPLTEFAPFLRYVAKANGNIYETFADKIAEKQFSKTIIPQIYEAFFGNKGESVIMRYLKTNSQTIETFVGNLPKELLGGVVDGTAEIKGSFLPENIKDISISPDTSSMFYLFNVGENMIGTTMDLTSLKKVQIFSSPFTEWLSSWPNSKKLTLTTKPASGIPGYIYALTPNNTGLSKIFGEINGLTTLVSPDGKSILYGDDNLFLKIYYPDTNTTNLLGVKTLPEKCVWNNGNIVIYCAVPRTITPGAYPDSWYQGEISFGDQFWKIDLKTGNVVMIFDPLNIVGGEDTDGIKLALDASESYLFFVNKKDSFLWEFFLK